MLKVPYGQPGGDGMKWRDWLGARRTMLELPKSGWERVAPFVLAGVAVVVLVVIGAAAFLPRMKSPPTVSLAAAPAEPASPDVAAPEDTGPQNKWISWEDGKTSTYRIGAFDLDFVAVVQDELNAAKLRVSTPQGLATEITGDGLSWPARADVAVVQLDARKPDRQVLFASFSGGAHCCTTLTMLEVRDGAWRQVDLGRWDGEAPTLPRDIDGDGLKEFVFRDQRFLYTFDSYAGSWAPPLVMTVADGRMRDVSEQARFRSVYGRELADARGACGEGSNGACAGYVAIAARTGQLDEAWAFMLRSYDQQTDWTYPVACRVRTGAPCPAGAEMSFATFPESLQWFLGEEGYTSPSYVEPLNARGPSFSCGAARKASERVICANDALAALDRLMARAYTRATALTPQRSALRASQREFLATRDQSDDPATLHALYIARIRELSTI